MSKNLQHVTWLSRAILIDKKGRLHAQVHRDKQVLPSAAIMGPKIR